MIDFKTMVHTRSLGGADLTILRFAQTARSRTDLERVFANLSDDRFAAIESAYPSGYPWSFNGAVVSTGESVVVVDTGFSFKTGDRGTGLAELLDEAGISPESVTHIVVTHGHGDHVGGLLDNGTLTFPDVELIVSRDERSHWFGQSGSPAAAAFEAYRDQTRTVAMDELLVDDGETTIRAIPLPGHTPGQIGLQIRSHGETLRLLADTVHTLFQLDDLDLSPSFDSDPDRAVQTRKRVLSEAAQESVSIGMFHFPFPGLGRLESTGDAFRWAPASEDHR